jgi:hypothetical protein
LIVNRLDERALAQQQLVRERYQAVAYVLAQAGDELDPMLEEELWARGWETRARIAEELATERLHALEQGRDGLAIVDVTAGEAEGEQLAAIIDDPCSLKP